MEKQKHFLTKVNNETLWKGRKINKEIFLDK